MIIVLSCVVPLADCTLKVYSVEDQQQLRSINLSAMVSGATSTKLIFAHGLS